jgi:glycosidase
MPMRQCGLRIWHKPASPEAFVQVIGDWDGWKEPGREMDRAPDGQRVVDIDVPPGEHAYAIVEDGTWLTDRNEALTGMHGDRDVTIATAPDCDRPALRVDGVETSGKCPAGSRPACGGTSGDGKAIVRATFLAARSGKAIDAITAHDRDGATLNVKTIDPASGTIELEASDLSRGKYTYTLEARDTAGVDAEDARATVWMGFDTSWDPRDALVYQVVIDRYRDASGPLATPSSPSARAGGTLAGVRRSLDEIGALGATAIWLSPLYANPKGEFSGNDGRSYSSYHGYWPIASRTIEERFASEAELDDFVRDVHSRGMRVLFDVVPNHVHEQHPWVKEHASWFNHDCTCGQSSCDWGAHIKTCSFAPYLPDLDWSNTETALAETNDVLWWFDRWDADGIRIDAVPMMPRAATRRIAGAVRKRYAHPGNALYVLGENFTGPGGFQSLRYDLGPYGLDGSFHFPLMWTLREAIARETQPLSAVDETFRTGEEAFQGSEAVMGLMIGNHDVSRFASVSAGNDEGDTWSGPPQPIDPIVYAKQRLALATVLTLPGAPVIYYGDEVGLAGRSDPDCRRVMPADDALIEAQLQTRELARTLGRARAKSRALRRGTLRTLVADDERFVFARELEGETAIVSLVRRPSRPLDVPLPAGTFVDVVSGARVEGTLSVAAGTFDAHVYLASGTQP